MPRKQRNAAPGFHHVWVNATGNWPYFLDDVDRIAWVRLLVKVADRYGWNVAAFCQMTTHVHALLEVPPESLSEGMLYLNREYSRDFNALHQRYGQFLRRRYGSRRIEGGGDLLGAYAYVVLNPVKGGLCPAAEDWRWSSYATTLGLTQDFPFIDAGKVIAELGGSIDALRRLVTARATASSEEDTAGTWYRTRPLGTGPLPDAGHV